MKPPALVLERKLPGKKMGLQPGAVRGRLFDKNSQAHSGVSALNPLSSRNTGYQPLPRPLGLPPYHYSLTDNFPAIAAHLEKTKKMVFHIAAIREAWSMVNTRPT